jgi:hypothetical protein
MAPTDDSERDAAVGRLEGKRVFQANVVSYLAVNVVLVAVWAIAGGGFFWPIFVILGWGLGVVSHGWQVYGERPITEDEEVQRGKGTVA